MSRRRRHRRRRNPISDKEWIYIGVGCIAVGALYLLWQNSQNAPAALPVATSSAPSPTAGGTVSVGPVTVSGSANLPSL